MENPLQNTVRVERAKKEITQKELAIAVNCTHVTIHNIEKGSNLNVILALKIAEYFGRKVDDIFTLK